MVMKQQALIVLTCFFWSVGLRREHSKHEEKRMFNQCELAKEANDLSKQNRIRLTNSFDRRWVGGLMPFRVKGKYILPCTLFLIPLFYLSLSFIIHHMNGISSKSKNELILYFQMCFRYTSRIGVEHGTRLSGLNGRHYGLNSHWWKYKGHGFKAWYDVDNCLSSPRYINGYPVR